MLIKLTCDDGEIYVSPSQVTAIAPRDDKKKGCTLHLSAPDLWYDFSGVTQGELAGKINAAMNGGVVEEPKKLPKVSSRRRPPARPAQK